MKKIILFIFTILIVSTAAEAAVLRGDLDLQGDVTIANGCWELISETDVTVAITDLTISGLNGNTDDIYRLNATVIGSGNDGSLYARINGDNTADIYGYQVLLGNDSSLTASRDTTNTLIYLGSTDDNASNPNVNEFIFNGQSGKVKAGIFSVLHPTLQIQFTGQSYNSTNEVTSITIYSSTANEIGVGSHIELWRKVS